MSPLGMHASRLIQCSPVSSGLHRYRAQHGKTQALTPLHAIAAKCSYSGCACPCAAQLRPGVAAYGASARQASSVRGQTLLYCTANTKASSSDDASTQDAGSNTAPARLGVDAVFTTRTGARWRVRPYDNSDYAAIIDIQTNSFHTTNPVPFLNSITYNNFRAEVVDGFRKKTRYSDPSIFQLLVAEEVAEQPAHEQGQISPRSAHNGDNNEQGKSPTANGPDGSRGQLVGVVEVSLLRERRILRALWADQIAVHAYPYVSSMCVEPGLRRKGVAQALFAAAEAQARLWQQPLLTLDVYRDNTPAVRLYENCGMRILSQDPDWKALLGDRVRLLMYKELMLNDEGGRGLDGSGRDAGSG